MSDLIKSFIYRLIALLLLIIFFPLMLILFLLIKLSSKGPFLFKQKRIGKDKKVFVLYKIRTMVDNAEELKKRYQKLNQADGPVFKIRDDPRYTKIGKLLSHTGLDELPQLINIVKGEMSFVGPRPLPVDEALKVPKKYQSRFSVLPGITSPWIIKGAHNLTFDEWMKLDLDYVKNQTILSDIIIFSKTIIMMTQWITKKFLTKKNH